MRAKLEDVCTVFSDGDWIESKDQSDKGIRLVQTGNIGEGLYLEKEERAKYVSEETFESLKCTEIYPGDILISRLPEPVGRACIIPPKKERMITAVDCTICRVDESIVSKEYMCYFMRSNAYYTKLLGSVTGTTRKRISRKNLGNIELEIPPKEEQTDIVSQLEGLINVINSRNKELQLFDNLIKARFVEMFGDPVSNPYGYDKVALSDLADIKIGPFGSLLHKEDYIDGGHPLLNPSHIVDGKVSPDDKLTISDEKYEELSAYQLKTGDVVMGRRGEMGRCAVVPEDGFLCGTGSMLIRTKGEVTADYIQKIISFPSFKKTIEDMAVGQTMPNLNVPIVSGFQIIKPPMEVQDRYYAFAEQVNKSKVKVQKALDETQKLFDSLMQQYFG